MLSTRDPPQNKRHTVDESKGIEMIFSCKWEKNSAGVATLISNKIDFVMKAITRDKRGQYIIVKVSIQPEDITLVNI